MYDYNFKLIKVVDGDTIDVDIDLGFGVWLRKQRVRMMGIDTPESRTRDLEEKKYGLLAKDKLIELVAGGRFLKTFLDKKGKYGRILGDVEVFYSVQNRWCGATEIMIKEGYGVPYNGQSKDVIQEQHIANRTKLKENGIIV
jgi:micrococcal nuclease